ncbi:hypothetical protein [Microcoleus sp.]
MIAHLLGAIALSKDRTLGRTIRLETPSAILFEGFANAPNRRAIDRR